MPYNFVADSFTRVCLKTAHHQFMDITVPHSTCISLETHVLFVSLIVVYSVGLQFQPAIPHIMHDNERKLLILAYTVATVPSRVTQPKKFIFEFLQRPHSPQS